MYFRFTVACIYDVSKHIFVLTHPIQWKIAITVTATGPNK